MISYVSRGSFIAPHLYFYELEQSQFLWNRYVYETPSKKSSAHGSYIQQSLAENDIVAV